MQLIDGPKAYSRHQAVKFAIFVLFICALVSFFLHTSLPFWALFALLNMGFFIYFAPTFYAAWVNRPNLPSIMAINTFLGFTGVGWVVALTWALLDSTAEERQAGLGALQNQLSDYRKELDACKKQIDELRGYIILLNDHQTYANKMIESISKRK